MKKIIKKYVFLIRDTYKYLKRVYSFDRKYWSREYSSGEEIAKDEQKIHLEIVQNCVLGVVEIGVLLGTTSKILANANNNIPVYGIDPIIPDSMNSKLIGNIEKIKKNTENCKNFFLIKDYSFNVVKSWDKLFDYIFIDGDHTYKAVKQDYEEWLPKLSKGGYIALHDSTMNRSNIQYWSGPSVLADEIIKKDARVDFFASAGTLTVFRKK